MSAEMRGYFQIIYYLEESVLSLGQFGLHLLESALDLSEGHSGLEVLN